MCKNHEGESIHMTRTMLETASRTTITTRAWTRIQSGIDAKQTQLSHLGFGLDGRITTVVSIDANWDDIKRGIQDNVESFIAKKLTEPDRDGNMTRFNRIEVLGGYGLHDMARHFAVTLVGWVQSEYLSLSEVTTNKSERHNGKKVTKLLEEELGRFTRDTYCFPDQPGIYTTMGSIYYYVSWNSVELMRELLSIAFSRVVESAKNLARSKDTTVTLSINPLDIVMMSEHTNNWTSCQNILRRPGSMQSMFPLASVGYAMDQTTMIAYTHGETKTFSVGNESIDLPLKNDRMLVYYDQDTNAFVLGRHYNVGCTPNTALAQGVISILVNSLGAGMTAKLAGFSALPRVEWCDVKSMYGCSDYVNYPNYVYRGDTLTGVLVPEYQITPEPIAGANIPCFACGDIRYRDDTFRNDGHLSWCCESCGGYSYHVCSSCGDDIDQDEEISENGDVYCSDCHSDLFTECHNCGDSVPVDDVCDNDRGNSFCYSCYHNEFSSCTDCGCEIRLGTRNERYTPDGELVCPDCHDTLVTTCEDCNDQVMTVDAIETSDREMVCDSCHANRAELTNQEVR